MNDFFMVYRGFFHYSNDGSLKWDGQDKDSPGWCKKGNRLATKTSNTLSRFLTRLVKNIVGMQNYSREDKT